MIMEMRDSSIDRISLVSVTRKDEDSNNSQQSRDLKKIPRYYEGVYSDERTISGVGDIDPVLFRSPISRGILNLPRYVPKYTVNSRLHGINFDKESISDSKTSRTYTRSDGTKANDDGSKSVPFYGDDPIYTKRQQGKETNKKIEKKSNAKNSAKKNTSTRCCRCRKCSCTSKGRRIACIVFVVLFILAALAGIALGLYFGYYEKFGDANQMAANFTIKNANFQSWMLNLMDPSTQNLTYALCGALKNILENSGDFSAIVPFCSAVAYTNGSIIAIFNIDVRHKRDAFMNNGNGFLSSVKTELETDFSRNPGQGRFSAAISSALNLPGNSFSIIMNELAYGYQSAIPTFPAAMTTTKSVVTTSAMNASTASSMTITTTTYNASIIPNSQTTATTTTTTTTTNTTTSSCCNNVTANNAMNGTSANSSSSGNSVTNSLKLESTSAIFATTKEPLLSDSSSSSSSSAGNGISSATTETVSISKTIDPTSSISTSSLTTTIDPSSASESTTKPSSTVTRDETSSHTVLSTLTNFSSVQTNSQVTKPSSTVTIDETTITP